MSSMTIRVEKATSDLLIAPDWTMNIDICDSINTEPWLAKDVVKAVKKRLQHKSPRVQLLALTLLETMIKNCGDHVHVQVTERNILQEMIKIVKKKTDMQVRDKILVLLDSWQEAFGGPGGKYPQYYWAYDELRRSGVQFPQRSREAAPIFTPPVTHPTARHAIAGYGMPSNTTLRLDEAMASEMESLSISNLNSMKSVSELLDDMLQALNPGDTQAVKDEVIEDLVNRCRSNQKKLMQLLNSTVDEELLGHGLELNDSLQTLLAKHDAIASGTPLPPEPDNSSHRMVAPATPPPGPPHDAIEVEPGPSTPPKQTPIAINQTEEDEEDDDFAQLARRRSKPSPVPSQSTHSESSDHAGVSNSSSEVGKEMAVVNPSTFDQANTGEQDMIDLLSITLSTNNSSPQASLTTPSTSGHNGQLVPVSPPEQGGYSHNPQSPHINQVPYNNYVAPWARPYSQTQIPFQQPHQYPQYTPMYPPPPWAAPSYSESNMSSSAPYPFQSHQAGTAYMPMNAHKPLQTHNSFPSRGHDAPTAFKETETAPSPAFGSRTLQQTASFGTRGNDSTSTYSEAVSSPKPRPATPSGQKPFIPSYRLFEDLIDLRNSDGSVKTGIASTTGFSGSSGQSLVGGRK